MIKTYSELITIKNFRDRFRYLKLDGFIGEETFGTERHINQIFYKSNEWLKLRDHIILRDNGCDLGVEGYEIFGRLIIHHIVPITIEDIINRTEFLLDPEFLICCSKNTHDAIHYSDEQILITEPIVRSRNDTSPWLR